jgi:RNA polymerase sigma-70 factor (ECF subfamily)
MKTDDTLSDEDLVLHVQKGSHEAFSVLVRRHTQYLYRIVWRTCPDRSEAEDIVQNVFMNFWTKPQSYDVYRDVKFKTWLTRVAINKAIDFYRKKRPIPDYEYLLQQSLDDPNMPLHDLERHIQKMELEQAINNLPEMQKWAVNLCLYEGIKNKEAAEIMEVSVKAVEALLMRARTTLKGVLKERRLDVA